MIPVANTPMAVSISPASTTSGLLATASPGVLVLASDGTATLLNSQAEALWGVPAAAVVGQVPAAVLPAVLPPSLLEWLRPVPDGTSASQAGEYWLPHTGQWAYVRIDPAPDGTRWVYWENITAQQAEKEAPPASNQTALQQSHERLLQVLESTSDTFYSLDAEWRFTYVNQRAARLWGRELGTLLGQPYQQAFPQAVGSEMYRRHQEVRRSRQPAHFETVSPILGIWIDVSVYPGPDGGLSVFFRDISARKRAEDALRQSEEKFRQFVTTSSDTLYRMSPDWRQMLTLDGQNFLADTPDPSTSWVEKYLPPEDQASTWATIHAAIASRQPFELEHRVYRADGSVGWTHSRAVPVLNAQGDVVEWFGAATNITARKQAEAALAQAHERLQLAMNVGRIFSFEMDPATRALELSDNTDLVLGFPLPDHIDSTFQLIHPDDVASTVALINGAIDARGSYASEYRLVNPANGEVVWFHSQAAFSKLNERDEWRFVGIAQNITESKRAQEALRASEEKYRTLFETMNQGFAVCELVRDETGQAIDFRYLELNPAMEQQTGLRRDLALRSTATQLVPGLEHRLVETFARVVETGEPARLEYYVGPLDRWYLFLAFPQGGQRFAVLYDDITARKQAEEVLRQSAARQAYLLALSDALRSAADAVAIQDTVTRTALDYFRADRCYYGEITGDTVTIRRDAARPGLPSVAAVYSLSTMPVFQALLRERQPVVVADVPTSPVMDDYLKQLCLGFGILAHINVPVIKNGELVGMLCLTQGTPRAWTDLEVALVQETAERTWAAVERAHAEEALRESEALLQKAFSIETVGTLFFSLDGRMTKANEAFVRMHGYPLETLLTMDWQTLTAPEFWGATARATAELAERGETAPYEKQLVRPDGTRWWGLCAPTRLKGHGPAAECMAFIIDISERKQTEAQLQDLMASLETQVAKRTRQLHESHELLQSVLDTSLISMSVLKAVRDETGAVQDFRIAMANKKLERETGRTDLVGKLYAAEYPGIKKSGLYDLMLGVLATGEPAGLEYFYPHEGFHKWYACQFVKMDDGLVATNLDITERKRAEEERLHNFALLQQSEKVAGLGSWDYDLATGAFHWSDGMYNLFELPLGTPVTPSIYLDVALPEDRPVAERLVHQLLQEPSRFEKQLRVRVAGQVKTLRLKAEVLRNAAGQPERVLGVDLDISQVQRLEGENLRLRLTQQRALFEAVQAAQEAERKRIAEGLHNGIGQILYATKLRLDQLHVPELPAVPALVTARREADQLLGEAISQTRALAHELVPLVLEEFGLETALHNICQKMSSPTLRLYGQLVLNNEAPLLSPSLQLALYRIAQELAQNIVKHARGATKATLEVEITPEWVLMRAEDNGSGFASTLPATGLGLRTIRDRVALLGGELETGNALFGGAYVRLRLPLEAGDS